MVRVIVATHNAEKAAGLRGLLGDCAIVEPLPHDISPELTEPDGSSNQAIAAFKAQQTSARLLSIGITNPVVATDGGLLVPGLGKDWDPSRTRRFAGPGARPNEIATALLERTAGLSSDEQRRIGWIEATAVALRGRVIAQFVAESPPGLLALLIDPRLTDLNDGFWVPYVWRCPEFGGRLLVDLTAAERDARDDHWSQVGRQLRALLASLDDSPRVDGEHY